MVAKNAAALEPLPTAVDKATSNLINSQTDSEEEKALQEIASKIQTEEEQSEQVLNMVRAEQAKSKKHDVSGEIEMLKSGKFD